MSLRWRPRLSFPDLVLTLSQPMRPPRPTSQGIGAGREKSAAGIPSVWPGRRERGSVLVLQGVESEWPAVVAFMERAVLGEPFTLKPDRDQAAVYSVYLERPSAEDRIAPDDGQIRGMWTYTIEVVTVDGAPLHIAYFGL
jgi:hypothetical protein